MILCLEVIAHIAKLPLERNALHFFLICALCKGAQLDLEFRLVGSDGFELCPDAVAIGLKLAGFSTHDREKLIGVIGRPFFRGDCDTPTRGYEIRLMKPAKSASTRLAAMASRRGHVAPAARGRASSTSETLVSDVIVGWNVPKFQMCLQDRGRHSPAGRAHRS